MKPSRRMVSCRNATATHSPMIHATDGVPLRCVSYSSAKA
jgi:hypothetical protein